MLKTRITQQYGLKIPFINAGMAFIATAPLVRAVSKAGGMGMLDAAAMPPDVLQAALRDIKAADPDVSGSISLHGSAASSTSRLMLRSERCCDGYRLYVHDRPAGAAASVA